MDFALKIAPDDSWIKKSWKEKKNRIINLRTVAKKVLLDYMFTISIFDLFLENKKKNFFCKCLSKRGLSDEIQKQMNRTDSDFILSICVIKRKKKSMNFHCQRAIDSVIHKQWFILWNQIDAISFPPKFSETNEKQIYVELTIGKKM